MDPDFLWHALSGGALITAAVALARLLLDYVVRPERALEARETHELKRRERERDSAARAEHERQDRERCEPDAQARLERILQDRLAEADRRLERSDAELRAERVRVATLEHDLLRLQQACELLRAECASLQQLAEAQRPSP